MFSPMTWMASVRTSATLAPSNSDSFRASTSAGLFRMMAVAILSQYSPNFSLMATKSVSQLTSTTAALPQVEHTLARTRPSLVARPAFLAAAARPRVRRMSVAPAMSPSASTRAFLHSIMPAPVASRSSLTIAAVMFAITQQPPRLQPPQRGPQRTSQPR